MPERSPCEDESMADIRKRHSKQAGIKEAWWAYGVVASMFDFHRSDRDSNSGRGGKISSCLRVHYGAAPLASVQVTISHGFTQAM